MRNISCKLKYVRTDGWRGYSEPINAVCGANNTGGWSDSPCPENVCLSELKQAKSVLRKNNIPYKTKWCRTSNVFCIHGYILTHEGNRGRAKELIEPLISETRLLYLCE